MARTIAYWVLTGLLAASYLGGGYFDVAQPAWFVEETAKLGYPLFFFTILGIWKLGAAVALVLPGLPRLKEWAYAGLLFNLTGASATHVFVKDPTGEVVTPLILLAMAHPANSPASAISANSFLV